MVPPYQKLKVEMTGTAHGGQVFLKPLITAGVVRGAVVHKNRTEGLTLEDVATPHTRQLIKRLLEAISFLIITGNHNGD